MANHKSQGNGLWNLKFLMRSPMKSQQCPLEIMGTPAGGCDTGEWHAANVT